MNFKTLAVFVLVLMVLLNEIEARGGGGRGGGGRGGRGGRRGSRGSGGRYYNSAAVQTTRRPIQIVAITLVLNMMSKYCTFG